MIKERRAQGASQRAEARLKAIREGKEKKNAAESKKKAEKAKTAATASRGGQSVRIQSKMGAKGVPSKAGAKTR